MHRLTHFSVFSHHGKRHKDAPYPLPEDDAYAEESIPLTPSAAAMGYGGAGLTSARKEPGHFRRNRSEAQRLQTLMQRNGASNASLGDRPLGSAMTRSERLKAWMVNDGQRRVFILAWVLLHILVFGLGLITWQVSDDWTNARSTFGVTFAIAKAAAFSLNVDVAFILLPVCRNFITLIRRTPLNGVIPFDAGITFHKVVASSIVFWTVVHIVAHMVNFARDSIEHGQGIVGFLKLNFTTGPGTTGWIMTLCLVIMTVFALERARKKNYERFWFTHHLFIIMFVCWQLHGMFCMIQPDRPPFCSFNNIASFWKYAAVGGAIYVVERILREVRSRHRTYISKVIQHPSRVLEIHIRKEKTTARAGQWVFLNCPEISYWQWHPFTLTSAPEEEFLSLHVRTVGDFTVALAKALGCDFERAEGDKNHDRQMRAVPLPTMNRVLPRVMVDGPFGSSSEDYYKFETILLVGAGIGVTPFASILKDIWYRASYPGGKKIRLQKVYFMWICRDFESFEWFQSLLHAIEAQDLDNFIEIHTYITSKMTLDVISNVTLQDVGADKDPVTGLRAPTLYGRPNFSSIFKALCEKHPATDVGVFFCGPRAIGTTLHKMCNAYSSGEEQGTRFVFGKENF